MFHDKETRYAIVFLRTCLTCLHSVPDVYDVDMKNTMSQYGHLFTLPRVAQKPI